MEGEAHVSQECAGFFSSCAAESMVLDTSSSFGSTSSSASLTNLPPLRGGQGGEDSNDGVSKDGKVKLASSDAFPWYFFSLLLLVCTCVLFVVFSIAEVVADIWNG